MANESPVFEYCWLKVIKVRELEEGQTSGTPSPELADFAIWSCNANGGQALIPNPPLPNGTSLRVAGANGAVVVPTCAGCPTHPNAPKIAAADRFVPTPPPLPSTAGGASPTDGWQLECGTVLSKFDEQPAVVFNCFPVPGDRQAALAWLRTPVGVAWAEDAAAITLLSYFH